MEPANQILSRTYSAKPSNLTDLSDKDLLRIFDNLSPTDLCAMIKTSTRFEQIAKYNFSMRFDKITWRISDTRAKMVFKTFGGLIKSLDIDVIEPQNEFFELLANVCGNRLENLSLWMNCGRPLNFETRKKLKSVFSHLRRLDVYCQAFFDLETTNDLLSSCYHLETLSLNCTTGLSFVWNNTNIHFPKLSELTFHFNQAINDIGLDLMLQNNQNITKLHLDECTGLSTNVIDIIVRCLPNLKEISLGYLLQNFERSDLQKLADLKQLKNLTIILGPALPLITAISTTGQQIEKLTLWYADVCDDVIKGISDIKTIRCLEFYSNSHVMGFVTDFHLEFLSVKLFNLNEIRLNYSKHVTINGLKKVLLNAKNLKYLSLNSIKGITNADKQNLLQFVNEYSNATNLTIDIDSNENVVNI